MSEVTSGYRISLLYDISSSVKSGQARTALTSVSEQLAQRSVCRLVKPEGRDEIAVEDMSSEVSASLSAEVKLVLNPVNRGQPDRAIELIVL